MNNNCKSACVLGLLLTAACGAPHFSSLDKTRLVDEQMLPFVEDFEAIYEASIGDVVVRFDKIEKPTGAVALCTITTYPTSEYREVTVDKDHWLDSPRETKLNIIFHELGHCVLDRPHLEDKTLVDVDQLLYSLPSSFMYPYTFYSKEIDFMEDYYKNEMIFPETKK